MNKAAILFAAVLAFGISPFITQNFQGYDPRIFRCRSSATQFNLPDMPSACGR